MRLKDARTRSRVAHARVRVVLPAIAALAAALAACGPTSSDVPSQAATTPGASTAEPSASVGSSPPPTSAASAGQPFDPTAVRVDLQPYAKVPGGPLAITWPDDGSGRLFVAAQDGRAWVVRDGATAATPLLDIRSSITTGGERGLLGLATHPDFGSHPEVFVDYTDGNGNTVVASYWIDPANPDRLDPTTARVMLRVDQPYANHNGGALAFGPDGDLYVSLGDGGSGGDPQGNGQRLDTLLGKILRIDIDHEATGQAYAIPAGNPFTEKARARPEIWLYGLRNPWRMSFDRATGNLWIGDVGQGAWEEVDVAPAGTGGLDYGWNLMEGSHCYPPGSSCDQAGLTEPVADYSHDGGACVVIGGVVYRGDAYPALRGGYVYSDYCNGTIWALAADAPHPAPAVVGSHAGQIAAYGEDQGGNLYAASLDGTIYRVTAAAR